MTSTAAPPPIVVRATRGRHVTWWTLSCRTHDEIAPFYGLPEVTCRTWSQAMYLAESHAMAAHRG